MFRQRKTSPRVVDGRVQFKNNRSLTCDWTQTEIPGLRIARARPGHGFRHYLRKRDLERFVRLLPEWEELSRGLDAIYLAEGHDDVQGYHQQGIVALCAWPKDLEEEWERGFFDDHRKVLDRLSVEVVEEAEEQVRLRFTEAAVIGFQLMHVFLHELGHHHDRMTTRRQKFPGRGEGYAEAYALRYAEQLWDAYYREFPF